MIPRPRPHLIETAPAVAVASSGLAPDDVALLAWVLSRSDRGRDCSALAGALLARFETLAAVLSADASELQRIPGADSDLASDLQHVRLLLERAARAEASLRPVIGSWSVLLDYVRIALAGEPREQFRTLFLDRRNRLLTDELVAHGTIDHAPAYPREVVRRALEVSAASLILVHNHPSGDPAPSQADIAMTRRIVDAARVFNLQVHDHLIVGREGVASLRSLGLMT